jgi:hypothetical protein
MSFTFEDWHRKTADMPGWGRREAFRFLPQQDQDAAWDALDERCQLQHEADCQAERQLLYEPGPPAKRHQPMQRSTAATSTRPGTVAVSSGDDPLKAVPPAVYFEVLAGIVVPPNGWVSCPMPDHEDRHPSCQVLSTHWRCFSCGRGGGIVDLAAGLHGIEPRGRGYWRLRDLILERLLWAPIRPKGDT